MLSYSNWIPGFEPLTSEMVFERSKPSCYANREFAHAMTEGGGHFVLAGFSGEAGCLATAVDAFHRGHRVTYLADASASLGLDQIAAPTVHETVTQLIGLYGDVTTTRSWISEQTANVSCWGGKMKSTIDAKLDLMARSLQEHINLAKELNLNFVAQLLTMTAMEIRINLHRISEQEMDTLCACAEPNEVATRAGGDRTGDPFSRPRPLFLTRPANFDGSGRA